MEFEIWWLLGIPAFFGLGWIAARIDIKQLLSESRSLPQGYFKGLNFLLNEQPDKAIDAFIEIVKFDPETADLHFALGNLFRRRGETERAIRMHQNLLSRPDLPLEQKLQAQYELGKDYLKAGLLDRAEEVFEQGGKTFHTGSWLIDCSSSRHKVFEVSQQVAGCDLNWVRLIKTPAQIIVLSRHAWRQQRRSRTCTKPFSPYTIPAHAAQPPQCQCPRCQASMRHRQVSKEPLHAVNHVGRVPPNLGEDL